VATEAAGAADVAAGAVARAVRVATRLVFLLFAGSIPAEYSLVLPGLGSITRILGALLLMLVAVDVLGGRPLRRPHVAFVLLAAFVAWSLLSLAWSAEPAQTLGRATTYAQLLVMSWIAWEYVRTERDFALVLQLFVLGALFVAAVTIREFNLINLAGLVITDLRVSAFGANPNELGLTMAIAVPVSLHLVRQEPRGLALLINGTYLVVGPVAVILTASRSAAVALGIAFLAMLVMLRDARAGTKVLVGTSLGAVGAIGLSLIPAYTWERIASIGAKLQRMDFNNRAANWRAGLEAFADQPFLGVGAGAFQGASSHLIMVPRSSHSTWLGVLVETGLVGAVLWFGAIAMALLGLRHATPAVRRLLVAMIVPMMVGMLVTGWDHRKVPWFVFTLALVAAELSRCATARAARGVRDP
jgi:O-antigen ligase